MPLSQPTHQVHHGDLPYSNPVLRSASPSGSINTEYGPDETSKSDSELSPDEFQRKIEQQLRIHYPREEEVSAEAKALRLPPMKPGTIEEKMLLDQIMRSLRWHVSNLEENEIYENMMLRGSQIPFDSAPSSNDIDAIMQSMMGPPLPSNAMHVDDASTPAGSGHVQSHQHPPAYANRNRHNGFSVGKGKGRAF
ncbi:hypothetical protein OF83DRAFT_912372 [Amylostereum chailletii]|nr:hypothetical protein OF83DRAFT_912372 [Amylostereum chailletii]